MKVSELATTLNTISDQISKAQGEIVAEIQNLKDALANTEVPADAEAAINKLSTLAQGLDDLNPDKA